MKSYKYHFFSQEKTRKYILSFGFNGSEKDTQNKFPNKGSTGVNKWLEGFRSERTT